MTLRESVTRDFRTRDQDDCLRHLVVTVAWPHADDRTNCKDR
jgi:hypothetical protein